MQTFTNVGKTFAG